MCSSSNTTCGAVLHMYSIASWSPSQSEPLILSYMCQCQLSSDMLPSEAPMPPCAATVCERVGKTLERTATDNPASASCSDARMPEPPAPSTSASNFRTGTRLASIATLIVAPLCAAARAAHSTHAPQDLDRPADVRDEQHDRRDQQREPHADGLHVVHEDVADADPRVP